MLGAIGRFQQRIESFHGDKVLMVAGHIGCEISEGVPVLPTEACDVC